MAAEQDVLTSSESPEAIDSLKIETGPKGFARFFSIEDAQRLQLAFDPDAASLALEGKNLRLTTSENRAAVLQDVADAASSDASPVLVTPEGEEVSLEAILELLQQEPEPLETAAGPAAGPAATSGGGSTYGDNLGVLIRLLRSSPLNEGENGAENSQFGDRNQPEIGAFGDDDTTFADGPSLPGLFTDEADTVDFNLLRAGDYEAGSQYDALSGDDVVTLPDDAAAASRAGYDAVRTFGGGAGDDTLNGGRLDDTLEGGAGADVISGGGGSDTASYAGSGSGVSVNLGAGTASGGDAEGDSLSSIENLTGSSHDDTLVGDGGANVLSGGAGDDTLMSSGQSGLSFDGTGAAILSGYSGLPSDAFTIEVEFSTTATNDSTTFSYARPGQYNEIILFDMADLKVYIGGRAVDTNLVFNDGAEHRLSVTWDSASGDVSVYDNGDLAYTGSLRRGYSLTDGGTLVLGQEQDRLGGSFDPRQSFDGEINSLRIWDRALTGEEIAEHHGQDMIDPADPDYGDLQAEFLMNEGSGDTLYDSINGQTASLTASGTEWTAPGGGDDTLLGGEGDDRLLAGAGDDTLEGGSGADVISGGGGTDTASYAGSGSGVSVNLGTGTASGGDAEGDSLSSIENLTGSSHDDTLVGDGGTNVLSGGTGDDTLMSSGQSGLSFDGTGAAILSGYSGMPSDAFTIEVEFATTATNDSTTFSYARPGQYNEIILFDMADLKVYIGGRAVDTNLAFNDGAEHRLSVTWDSASGDVSVYDNGELAYSGSLQRGYSLTDGGTLVLGQEQDRLGGSFDPRQSFDGEINSLRIWDRALSGAEIAEHHAQDMIDPADPDYGDLQAEFLMNEGSGNTLYDSVNGQTASLTASGTEWTTSGGDTLDGGEGADTLISGSGNDLLIGGDGGDDFRIDLSYDGAQYRGPGDDVIQDFTTADKLTISSVLDETGEGDIDLDDLLGHVSVSDSGPGGDVTLSFDGGGSITLLGIGTGDLNSLDALTEASFQIEVGI